jgi:pimeloyl-ACP methyl ester carboxylesterase
MSEARIIRLPGADLRIAERGSGPTTIFLHGFGGDLHTWDRLWPLLPAGTNYIRYDLRGFGQSVARDNTSFDHADDLADLMDAMQIDRCDIVGLSMGGSVALNFALTRPDRVRSLSLLSPGLTAWDWSDEWRALWRPISEAARAGDLSRARELWLAHPLFATTRASDAEDALRDEIARFSGDQWVEDHQAPALPDVERLHELDVPVLLLTGAQDLADFQLVAELIEACAPHVTRHDASDAGHLIHLEALHWCRNMLSAFWRRGTA